MEQFAFLSILFSLSSLSCHILPITNQNDQNDMASMMTLMEQTITTLQSQMTASNKELASVKTQQLSTETELSSVKSSLQSQLLAADTELTTVKSRLKTTESELAIVKNNFASAQAEIDDLAKSPDPDEFTKIKADLAILRVQYGSGLSSNTHNMQILNTSCNSLQKFIGHIKTSSQKNAADIAGLKTELSSELTKVKSLDTDVNVTKTLCQKTLSDLQSLNSNISEVSGKVTAITASRIITSFEVLQSKDNVPYDDKEILKFDDVTLNSGNTYDPQTGIFLAPVDGTYLFWANVMSHDTGHFYISLQKEGHVIVQGYTGEGVNGGTATIVQVIQLKKGDRLWFYHTASAGNSKILGVYRSSYGGTLLYV